MKTSKTLPSSSVWLKKKNACLSPAHHDDGLCFYATIPVIQVNSCDTIGSMNCHKKKIKKIKIKKP